MRANFLLISFIGFFNTRHYLGLKGVAFLKQLVDTLRVRLLRLRQSL